VIPQMTERKVTDDRNSAGRKEFVQQRGQLGLVSAAFELADQHTSDASQSTRQPEGGQHTVQPVKRLVDVFPEPDSIVDPEVIRSSRQRRRQGETAAEEQAGGFSLL